MAARYGLLAVLLLLTACQENPATKAAAVPQPKPSLVLAPASWGDLPGWQSDSVSAALPALLRSCDVILGRPAGTSIGIAGTVEDWQKPCADARHISPADDAQARAFFEADFRPFNATDHGTAEGLFTGYYEASLRGSRTPAARYRVPLYRRPPDLVSVDLGSFRQDLKGERIAGRIDGGKLVPYADRRQIETGALAGKGLEIVWVDSAADAFFLAVQGSGRVSLAQGGTMRLGYNGENGWPYVSIGHVLATRGVPVGQIDMPFLRQWLIAHPDEAKALLDTNPSYIFFKEMTGDGPLGSEGVVLTPERSAAVDRRFVPMGMPVWIDTSDPIQGQLRRLLIAQDTGGAIRGPVRADIFFGFGPEAETHAGLLKGHGRWWLLLPQGAARRRDATTQATS